MPAVRCAQHVSFRFARRFCLPSNEYHSIVRVRKNDFWSILPGFFLKKLDRNRGCKRMRCRFKTVSDAERLDPAPFSTSNAHSPNFPPPVIVKVLHTRSLMHMYISTTLDLKCSSSTIVRVPEPRRGAPSPRPRSWPRTIESPRETGDRPPNYSPSNTEYRRITRRKKNNTRHGTRTATNSVVNGQILQNKAHPA